MPIIEIRVSAQRSNEMTNDISAMVGELSQRILGKDPAVTAIVVEYVNPDDWIVGGTPLSAQGKRSFFLQIRITDETNTKAEKSAFVDEAFKGFARILGDLHEESYVHVHDVRAAAYGFGGRTQEYRYQHPR